MMLPAERLELAIYRAVNRGRGPVTFITSVTILSRLTGEDDTAAIVDVLKVLEDDGRIHLTKWSGDRDWPRGDSPDRTFFYEGEFGIQIASHGRKYFEKLEQEGEQEAQRPGASQMSKPLVFVSCGQSTDAERRLGQAVTKIVQEETGCTAYFAQNQATLEGLTENILKKLHYAVAFIAIMHPRGNVSNPNNALEPIRVRGSVWVEQEIAIATFISQALQRPIRVRAYIHEGIQREGIRDQLILNPKLFREDSEILEDLSSLLPSWRDLAQLEAVRSTKNEEMESLKAERDALKLRPYDEEHRRLAEAKVNKLPEESKDLLWFLLHHGKQESEELRRHCTHDPLFHNAVQRAREAGLVLDTQEGNPGRPSARYFWEVNPEFKAVLQDLLGKREPRFFR
jgi:hypothetical protein